MKKVQEKDWREGIHMALTIQYLDENGLKKSENELILFIDRDENFTHFEKLNGEKEILPNVNIRLQELWVNEDFYVKLGLKNMITLKESDLFDFKIQVHKLLEILGSKFDKIKFLKSLDLNKQCNPIKYQPKYKWSRNN